MCRSKICWHYSKSKLFSCWCALESLESVYAARSPDSLNMRLVLLNFIILSILVNIEPSELKSDMFWCFKNKCWASRPAAWNIPQSKVFQIWVKHLKTPSTVLMDLNPHFFNQFSWKILRFFLNENPCLQSQFPSHYSLPILSPHVESGGCCGPAYMAGTVWLMAPGATEVDWAPHGKSQLTRDSIWVAGFPFPECQPVFAVQESS